MNKLLKGFTIIELLIVIVIIGVLVGVTAVGYNSVQRKAKQAATDVDLASIGKQLDVYSIKNQETAHSSSDLAPDIGALGNKLKWGHDPAWSSNPRATRGEYFVESNYNEDNYKIYYWDYGTEHWMSYHGIGGVQPVYNRSDNGSGFCQAQFINDCGLQYDY